MLFHSTGYYPLHISTGPLHLLSFKCLFYLYECFAARVCTCTLYVPGTCGGQNKSSGPLELESGMVDSHHVGSGDPTWFLSKSNK